MDPPPPPGGVYAYTFDLFLGGPGEVPRRLCTLLYTSAPDLIFCFSGPPPENQKNGQKPSKIDELGLLVARIGISVKNRSRCTLHMLKKVYLMHFVKVFLFWHYMARDHVLKNACIRNAWPAADFHYTTTMFVKKSMY